MRTPSLHLLGALVTLACSVSNSFADFPTLVLKPVVLQQIHSPTTITYAPDGSGRLFVCDQLGKIYIVRGGMMLPTPFLNIASPSNTIVSDQGPGPVIKVTTGYAERGLLGLAFHPGYANSASPGYRKFYVYYSKTYVAGTDPGPPQVGDPVDHAGVLAEYQVSTTNPDVADPNSERRLMVFTEPQSNHNGGQLEFGPDGYLYFGLGDGGSQMDDNAGHTGGSGAFPTNNLGNAQDKTRIYGKILRINPIDPDGAGPLTYDIPSTNPFYLDPTPGLRKEIYSFGMRNPWRFSFDKRAGGTNRLFCGDVGGDRIEEVDIIISGGNYGWRYKEGTEFPLFSSGAPSNPMPDPGGTKIDPIAMYAHIGVTYVPPGELDPLPQLGLSVTGGFVYRGAAIPALQGKYVFGDYGSTQNPTPPATWDSRLMGLEETSPNSGVFTLTETIPLKGITISGTGAIVNQRILGFGEDESGEIYVGMKTKPGVLQLDGGLPSGGIYKIVPLQNYTKTLTPSKDNTIFSEDDTYAESNSDARGWIYTGMTGSSRAYGVRRGLVAFDVAGQVPAGATIQSAQLKLNLTKSGPASADTTLSVHRLTETWGEGTSANFSEQGGFGAPATVNDATWHYRFFNTSSWSTAGGTFVATPSAVSGPLASLGVITWDSATQPILKSNVQGWIDTPASNAGWVIRGDEQNEQTACRFDSRDFPISGTPPALALTYTAPPQPTHFESWLSTYFPTNPVGKFVDPSGDNDGDTIPNLIEYAYGFSPVQVDPPDSGLQTSTAPAGANTVFTITFLRDPLATDLTYYLETSPDLHVWSAITTSVGGAPPTGSGFDSEDDQDALKIVTAKETLPAGSKRFARLRVVQQ